MTLTTIVLFLAGILAGLYASTVGGGSLISLPLLLFAGLPTPVAIATNRLSATILEFFSAAKFYKEGKLDLKKGFFFGFIASLGSIIGSQLVFEVDKKYLNLVVGILFLIAFFFIFNHKKLGLHEKSQKNISPIFLYLGIFLLGIYGGFFGAGFGTFIIIFLVLLGFDFIKSAAIGRMTGFLMSLCATLIFADHSIIQYSYALSLGAGMAIGSWIGIGVALKKGEKFVRTLLLIVFFLSILKLFWEFFRN